MELSINWQFIIGFDISKTYLDCYLLDRKIKQGSELQVENLFDGFDHLGQWLHKNTPAAAQTLFVSEHNGAIGSVCCDGTPPKAGTTRW